METPINNLEAEKSVLGSILVEKNAVLKIVGLLDPEDFYYEINGHIFDACLTLSEKKSPIDILLLSSLLEDRKQLEEVGGKSYLEELCDSVITSSHIVAHAKEVRDAAIFRALSGVGTKIHDVAKNTELSSDEAIEKAQRLLSSIVRSKAEERIIAAPKSIDKFEAFVRTRMVNNANGVITGIPTGFSEIDEDSLPEEGNFVIVAARPSVGKSAFAGNIAYNAAMMGSNVYYVSLEMTPEELMSRIYARIAKISSTRFKYGQVDEATLLRCRMEIGGMVGNLEFDFLPGATSHQILAKADMRKDLNLLIIDHIDLINNPMPRGGSRVQMLGEVTAALKTFAGTKNCVVIGLSQLSRDAKNEMPELFHLRDSGAKEQDADIVWLLHRSIEPDGDPIAYLRLAKNRTGRKGDIAMKFDAPTCTFTPIQAAPAAPRNTVGSWEDL